MDKAVSPSMPLPSGGGRGQRGHAPCAALSGVRHFKDIKKLELNFSVSTYNLHLFQLTVGR